MGAPKRSLFEVGNKPINSLVPLKGPEASASSSALFISSSGVTLLVDEAVTESWLVFAFFVATSMPASGVDALRFVDGIGLNLL